MTDENINQQNDRDDEAQQQNPVEPDNQTDEAQEKNAVESTDKADEELKHLEDGEATMESVIEAVLFASDEPLTVARLADIAETGNQQVRQHIEALNEKYEQNNHAFRIEKIASGYQMLTLPGYNHWLKKLLRARSDSKLSPAALETLAVIAYKQPVIRADIEAIRGVAAGEMIRQLMYKGLVKIVGRADVLGRPMLYGTTKKFLQVFGLNTLRDLPKIEELKKPKPKEEPQPQAEDDNQHQQDDAVKPEQAEPEQPDDDNDAAPDDYDPVENWQ